jgi:hypothetical protein
LFSSLHSFIHLFQDRRSIIPLVPAYRLLPFQYNLILVVVLSQFLNTSRNPAIMKSPTSILALLAILSSAVSASVLSTTDVATALAGAHDQKALTLPGPAFATIRKLGTGGANANILTASDKPAIDDCVAAARAGNTSSKAGLGGGTGTAGNIPLEVVLLT